LLGAGTLLILISLSGMISRKRRREKK